MNAQDIGRQIALLRREQDWSQTELAQRAGVSRAFVCNLERGTGSDPGLRKILNILELFSSTLTIVEQDAPPTLDDLLAEQGP